MALFQPIQQKGFTMIRVAGRLLGAVLTISLLCTSAAYADLLRLRVENLSTEKGVVVTDGGDWDIIPIDPFTGFVTPAGMIAYSGAINGFSVSVTIGLSKPEVGGINNYAELDLFSVDVKGTGAGTLQITLEDKDYTSGPNGELSAVGLVGGTLTAPTGSTATFQSWVNPNNLIPTLGADISPSSALPAMGVIPAGSVALWSEMGGAVTFGPGAFSSSDSEGFMHSGAYSLFTQATINFTGPGMVSFDSNLSTVPEPTSLLLLGSGLAGIGLWSRRKKKSAQV